MLASLGHATVLVHRRPKVAILATGDELLEVHEPLAPGKIRNSNEYTNAALVDADRRRPHPAGHRPRHGGGPDGQDPERVWSRARTCF